MHITLQIALQSATLVSVVIGVVSLVNAIRSYRRQMNAQLFMKYTERYERILCDFPEEARDSRFDPNRLPAPSAQIRLCVLKYLNLCSEEFYLLNHGYLDKNLWRIWEGELKRMIAGPLVRREWATLKSDFLSHEQFYDFVESLQGEERTHVSRA